MGTNSSNQGEGNREAAKNFNDAEQKFVNSPEGQAKIKKGAQIRPDEEADIERAEEKGRKPAKSDPNDTM